MLDVDLNTLVFRERAMPVSVDLGVVDEEVLRAVVRGDRAKALVTVEQFHSSLRHLFTSLISLSIGFSELAANTRSVSTRWRDYGWAKSIVAIRAAPDSMHQPLDQDGAPGDEEAFHGVLAIE
jgi:hypothetical protein